MRSLTELPPDSMWCVHETCAHPIGTLPAQPAYPEAGLPALPRRPAPCGLRDDQVQKLLGMVERHLRSERAALRIV